MPVPVPKLQKKFSLKLLQPRFPEQRTLLQLKLKLQRMCRPPLRLLEKNRTKNMKLPGIRIRYQGRNIRQ
jgi:hypothetical protein